MFLPISNLLGCLLTYRQATNVHAKDASREDLQMRVRTESGRRPSTFTMHLQKLFVPSSDQIITKSTTVEQTVMVLLLLLRLQPRMLPLGLGASFRKRKPHHNIHCFPISKARCLHPYKQGSLIPASSLHCRPHFRTKSIANPRCNRYQCLK